MRWRVDEDSKGGDVKWGIDGRQKRGRCEVGNRRKTEVGAM